MPFSLIGHLWKFLTLLYVLAVCLTFMYLNYSWFGVAVIVVGGVLLFRYWQKKEQAIEIPTPEGESSSSPILTSGLIKKVFFIALVGFLLIVGLMLVMYIASMNGSGIQSSSTIPMSITTIISTTPTIQPTHTSYSGQTCTIIGKWVQQDVTGYVYLQIFSDNRIEIYLNNQLRSWGSWEAIAPDQYHFVWTAGEDANPNVHTMAITPGCQTLKVVSFRGEHSTFARA